MGWQARQRQAAERTPQPKFLDRFFDRRVTVDDRQLLRYLADLARPYRELPSTHGLPLVPPWMRP